LSFYEAQGVEFDTVFVVGGEKQVLNPVSLPSELVLQLKNIEKDLLYVALTRAMSRLWVFGKNNLENIF
jgi:superfamily I DNA/RNA helicase